MVASPGAAQRLCRHRQAAIIQAPVVLSTIILAIIKILWALVKISLAALVATRLLLPCAFLLLLPMLLAALLLLRRVVHCHIHGCTLLMQGNGCGCRRGRQLRLTPANAGCISRRLLLLLLPLIPAVEGISGIRVRLVLLVLSVGIRAVGALRGSMVSGRALPRRRVLPVIMLLMAMAWLVGCLIVPSWCARPRVHALKELTLLAAPPHLPPCAPHRLMLLCIQPLGILERPSAVLWPTVTLKVAVPGLPFRRQPAVAAAPALLRRFQHLWRDVDTGIV